MLAVSATGAVKSPLGKAVIVEDSKLDGITMLVAIDGELKSALKLHASPEGGARHSKG